MDWMELYPDRKRRPGVAALSGYFSADVMNLFTRFANHLAREYQLRCDPAVYEEGVGWTFRFGKYGMHLLSGIALKEGFFYVDGIRVADEESLNAALSLADARWAGGFGETLAAQRARKISEQAERAKRRRERERAEGEALANLVDRTRFNRFRWSPKLSRRTLSALYASDAGLLEDEELADEVGYTLYARCLQGRDERALMLSGRMKCHNCGAILSYGAAILTCSCGSQYQFREYMRSFRNNNMPANSAAIIFNEYIEKWPAARTYREKMRLIDWLVHEFHLNLSSGVKGRFVGVNLIEGTKNQIQELILSLASGDGKDAARDEFARNLENR
jgi:hypothetical protein